ncbi:MAG TPA: preprotein translocase subunit YajC [Actinomycetota bacterium]|jgi:preprotein translocase subunit YajC|nr:preprotein translocase subunit YajC [Actinomycetota bacterium]
MMIGFLAQASEPSSGSGLVAFLPLILMGGVLYFIMIRPQKRQRQAQQALLNSLEVGDEVMTAGGIFGTIVDIDEDEDVLTVEVAPGTKLRMIRAGVSRKLVEDEYDDDDDDDEDAEPDEADTKGLGEST